MACMNLIPVPHQSKKKKFGATKEKVEYILNREEELEAAIESIKKCVFRKIRVKRDHGHDLKILVYQNSFKN